jgi:hypothetical protein
MAHPCVLPWFAKASIKAMAATSIATQLLTLASLEYLRKALRAVKSTSVPDADDRRRHRWRRR